MEGPAQPICDTQQGLLLGTCPCVVDLRQVHTRQQDLCSHCTSDNSSQVMYLQGAHTECLRVGPEQGSLCYLSREDLHEAFVSPGGALEMSLKSLFPVPSQRPPRMA